MNAGLLLTSNFERISSPDSFSSSSVAIIAADFDFWLKILMSSPTYMLPPLINLQYQPYGLVSNFLCP